MLTRGVVIWLGLLLLAIVNGGIREAVMITRIGESAGHAVSSVTLSAAILIVSWFAVDWIGPASRSEAWRVGILWLALTLSFEFIVGHYVFGNSWERLLADYNVLQGRLWVLVLIATVCAPVIAAGQRVN